MTVADFYDRLPTWFLMKFLTMTEKVLHVITALLFNEFCHCFFFSPPNMWEQEPLETDAALRMTFHWERKVSEKKKWKHLQVSAHCLQFPHGEVLNLSQASA